jgi:hypothetical protein
MKDMQHNEQPALHEQIVRMAAAEAISRAHQRRSIIAEAAYFRAEKRGFVLGHEMEDWLAAEIEVANVLQLVTLAPGEEPGLRRVS